jgi:hypothetical protein
LATNEPLLLCSVGKTEIRCIVSNKLDAIPFRRSFKSRDAAPEPDRAGMAAFERRAARPVSEQPISGRETCQLEVGATRWKGTLSAALA